MFKPEWLGKIDWKKGLYLSKNTDTENTKTINNKINNTNIEETINHDINKNILEDINIKKNEGNNTIITENKFNYNKSINLDIPYYNETIEYMNSKVSNKYDTNYYHLLDRIGHVSRFLLKGNDYYKSYISKNANKYYNDKGNNDKESNNREHNDVKQQYTKLSLNIKYQEIDKTIINDDQYDE